MAGRARICMSSMDECNTASQTRSRGLRDDLPEGKGGAWVVLGTSNLQLPLSTLYQPVLIGATASNIKNLEGLPLSYYTLERWGKIFQLLEVEAQNTPMLLHQRIKRAKGEGVDTDDQVVSLVEADPK